MIIKCFEMSTLLTMYTELRNLLVKCRWLLSSYIGYIKVTSYYFLNS